MQALRQETMRLHRKINFFIGLVAPFLAVTPLSAADSSVIFMYHRFGEHAQPTTNISIGQFESHIKELTGGAYAVLPVPEIIEALRNGKALPERTIGITVDDAYLSVYTEAWPRLKKAGLPFTLFINTDDVDHATSGSMTWDKIREMAEAGVTIGHQSASHPHMPKLSIEENRLEIKKGFERFEQMLGKRPTLFAYPYGEAGMEIETMIREAGFSAAFGQHSGVIGSIDDFYYLPRFSLNENYGDLPRFRLAANALALPVSEVTPADHLLGVGSDNPPAFGFTVTADIGDLDRLTCFTSHEGKADVLRLGENRIEVRMKKPMPKGRSRINCTVPAAPDRWRWLGLQFFVP